MMVHSSTGRTMGAILALLGYFLIHQQQIALVHAQHDMDPTHHRRNLRQNNAKEAMRLGGGHGDDAKLLERNLVQQCSPFELEIQLDNFAQEVYWELYESNTYSIYYSDYYDASSNNAIVNRNICIPPGSYNFTIYDWGDDGLCCGGGQGYYKFSVGGVLIKQGGNYGQLEWTPFDVIGSPTVSPAPTAEPSPVPNAPTQAPSSVPTMQCNPGEYLVKVDLKLDNFPTETSWTLMSSNGDVVLEGGNYSFDQANALVSAQDCLGEDAYTLTIFDSYGDGTCCSYGEGNYQVSIDGTGEQVQGNFLTRASVTVATPGASVPPTASPQPSASPTVSPQPTPLWTSGPTILWTAFPTSSPTPAPTVTCASNEVVFALDLMIDSNTTSWDVTDSAGIVLSSGGDYTYEQWKIHNELCLPAGSYLFTIYDTQGDGLLWGYYKLWMDGVLVKKGGPFGYQESTALESVP